MQKAVMQNIIMWIRRQACHAAVSVTAVKMTAAVCSAAGGGVITRDTGRAGRKFHEIKQSRNV